MVEQQRVPNLTCFSLLWSIGQSVLRTQDHINDIPSTSGSHFSFSLSSGGYFAREMRQTKINNGVSTQVSRPMGNGSSSPVQDVLQCQVQSRGELGLFPIYSHTVLSCISCIFVYCRCEMQIFNNTSANMKLKKNKK